MTFLAHPAVFAILYLIVMLATYVLPWLGSNSGLLNVAGAASGAGLHPLFWVHLLAYVIMVVLAWARGQALGKGWLVILPILAAIFDLVPGLNWIFGIPTIMNLLAVILGVALKPEGAAVAPAAR